MAGPSKLRKSGARRAAIVGGSMSGLLAGLLLRRAGWDVEIFERVESELSGRGAGIVAQPDLIATLARIGIDTNDVGVEIMTRKILDAAGKLVCELACPQVLTAWERVYRALRDAFPLGTITAGAALRGFAQNETPWPCTLRMDRRSRAISWSAPTACAQPSASNACRTWRRFMPAMSPGARSSRKRRSRQRSIASCSTT